MSAQVAPQYEVVDTCRACGNRLGVLWRERCPDRLGRVDRRFAYRHCAGCGARCLVNGPVVSDASAFYPDDYAPYVASGIGDFPMWGTGPAADPLTVRLRAVYTPPAPRARLLDFGCGSPAVLDAAREHGWDTAGADFSPGTVARLRQAGHEAWLAHELLQQRTAPFDLVRLNHVVEHLYHPRSDLEGLMERLRPGGVLHLATPNPNGVSARVFRQAWWAIEAPRHVVIFSPEALVTLLRDVGAVDIQVTHEEVTKDFARSASYLRADLGLGGRPGETPSGSRIVNRLARPLMRAAARRGHGDRFHVFARAPR